MNVYGIVILAALLMEYALEFISNVVNLNSLTEDLPSEFEGVYDREDYRKSQVYTRTHTLFGLAEGFFFLVVTLGFWFCGGFHYLDEAVRFLGLGPVLTGLLYIGILIVARLVLRLPFDIYSTFVIEERFGFNKTTARTFILDRIKGLALGIALAGPLLAALLFFLGRAGPHAWVYCWALVAAFILVMQLTVPTWVLPLFNKFRPLQEGDLKEAILSYARKVRFPLENIFVIDGSRRSTKSNAFFTGLGRQKRLALFDTLIEKHTVPEIVAVVAHEVGHFKKKHVVQGLLISLAHAGLLFYLLSIFTTHRGLFDAFYVEEMSCYEGLIFFGLLFSPIELVLATALKAVSRKNEYEADRFATTTVDDGLVLVDALRKLSVSNLTNLTPHPFHVLLHASHPTMLARIRAVRNVAANLEERSDSVSVGPP